jgi:leucyl aminopeptidase
MSKSPYYHSIDSAFTDRADGAIALRLVRAQDYDDLHSRASASFSRQMEQTGFSGKDRQLCVLRNEQGAIAEILAGVTYPIGLYTLSAIHEKLKGEFTTDFLRTTSFKLDTPLNAEDATNAATGWALAGYRFDAFKKDKGKSNTAVLVWPDQADKNA